MRNNLFDGRGFAEQVALTVGSYYLSSEGSEYSVQMCTLVSAFAPLLLHV